MPLPEPMRVGDKSVIETLVIWALPLLLLLGFALAIWGSVTKNQFQQ